MAKPRPDAKLLNLPEEQQAQLAEFLLSGMPYHQAQALVEKEFKVHVGLTAFSGFWQKVCEPQLIARRRKAVMTADMIGDEAEQIPGRFDAATIDALKQKAFELAISPQVNPRDVKAIFALVLKARSQDLDAQQLRLDREKFEFDAAKKALAALDDLRAIRADASLNDDAKLQAIRQRLFGAVPE
jgi:hypothetical protein